MRILRSFFLGVCLFCVLGPVWITDSQAADISLEVSRSEFQKIPIWVLGFADGGSSKGATTRLGNKIAEILKADLRRSQIFEVLDEPTHAMEFGTDQCQGQVDLSELKDAEATVMTWGRIGRRGTDLLMDVCEYDVGNDKVAKGKRYVGDRITMRLLRLMVHRWADQLVSHYTGESGIARTKIAYVSEKEGNRELFVMDYDGYGQQQVTGDGYLNLMPVWSPDRHSLVYTAFRQMNQEIVQLELGSGTKTTLVDPKGLNITPALSPDGETLAYASAKEGNSEIYTMNLSTQEVTQLTFPPGAALSPSWSPNGREIVFTSDRGRKPQLYIMSADGSNVRRLTFEGKYNAAPSWSPRGEWIAYVCRIPKQGFRLCRISPDGQERSQITSGSHEEMDDSPSWSPDGRHLVFSSMRNGQSHIYMINDDGTELEQLTSGGTHHSSPSWSPIQGSPGQM